MAAMASQITSLTIVYSTVYSGADQSKHQSSASLAFVWGIHRGPVNSPHKWPVTRKMFPFDDVIMIRANDIDLWSAGCGVWARINKQHTMYLSKNVGDLPHIWSILITWIKWTPLSTPSEQRLINIHTTFTNIFSHTSIHKHTFWIIPLVF